MSKTIIYRTVVVVFFCVLSACSGASGPQAGGDTNASATPSPVTSASPQNEQQDFHTGVAVDLNQVRDPLFNEQIKELLATALNALAEKDEQAFRSVFADTQTADALMYLFGKDYFFDQTGTVQQDQAGRVVVEIRGKVKDDTGVHEPNAYYYFIKNKQGEWALGAID